MEILHAESFRDLPPVTVAGGLERPSGAAPFRVMTCRGRLVAGFAGADQNLDDRRFHQPRGGQRSQGENGGRGVASGAGHEIRFAERLPVQLRDPVDEAAQEVRARMRPAVPALVGRGIPEPEVGSQIHDPPGDTAEVVDAARGLPVGRHTKSTSQPESSSSPRNCRRVAAAQVRMHAVGELPGQALGGDLGHLDFRMAEQRRSSSPPA